MHDLTTIQRMNAEATEQAMTQLAEEQVLADIDAERAEAMKRHPAGKRLTEPAQDAARHYDHQAGQPFEAGEGCRINIDGEEWQLREGQWQCDLYPPYVTLAEDVEQYDFHVVAEGEEA